MSSSIGMLIPLAAVTIGPIAWVTNNWIRVRHGYPLETAKGEMFDKDGSLPVTRQTELLVAENEKLHGQISRLEERLAVLERIATDPAERVSRDIEALR